MDVLTPLYTTELFGPLQKELVHLLRQLKEEDWERLTLAKAWRVRDVVAHLLDGDLRVISVFRDGHHLQPDIEITGYADLVGYLNKLNHQWVTASSRLSPRLLIELIENLGNQAGEAFNALPPHGKALYSVDWAGEQASENWMHIGREYTERWHHQMQIREATGFELLLDYKWYYPLLDFSMRALPSCYAQVAAPVGTVINIEVEGIGNWSLMKVPDTWELFSGVRGPVDAQIFLAGDMAWKVFYNALDGESMEDQLSVKGDVELARPFWMARSVMV